MSENVYGGEWRKGVWYAGVDSMREDMLLCRKCGWYYHRTGKCAVCKVE